MLKKLKQAIKKYGLFKIENENLFQLNRMYRCYKKLQKKYTKNITQKYTMPKEIKQSNKIWFCWLQGIDNAPEVAKACYKSILKNIKNKEVVVITKDNLSDYATFPPYIMQKWEKGIISNTHMSDLIRLQLLATHGGTWIDSTCLLTSNLPEYVENSTFFVFRNDYRGDESCHLSNWFIHAIANHPIILHTRDLVFEYWKNENKLIHYYFFHFFATMCMETYKDLLKDTFFVSNINPHTLQFEYLFKEFNETTYKNLKELCFIHKLSNKFDLTNKDITNTFYEELIIKNNF